MSKKDKNYIKTTKLNAPAAFDYYIPMNTPKDRNAVIGRLKKAVRGSKEYKDYIAYLKEHVDMDQCIFFQNINGGKQTKHNKITIEIHHEPFCLEDYCQVILEKWIQEGKKLNVLLMADEIMELHYNNETGLVPLSKTIHEVIHNSNKVLFPVNMCYGNYAKFLEDYADYIEAAPVDLYDKLQRKLDMTKNLTPESFEAIKKEFTYLDVKGYDEIEKMETSAAIVA